ncbi:MAG: low specificity L-threonine aldolase, partial [Rhodospirillales bacterium]|nr:low specificity L-threonine aldolase [Rhodospirillales bacterium]
YLDNDLWLDNARHANAMAKKLADGLSGIHGASFLHTVDANLTFVALPGLVLDGLEADGFQFYRMEDARGSFIRLVTAFNTDPAHVDGFIASAAQHAA